MKINMKMKMLTAVKSNSLSSSSFPRLHSTSSSSSSSLQFHSRNSVSFPRISFPVNPISTRSSRNFCTVSASKSGNDEFAKSSFQGADAFLRSVLASMEAVYLNRNPTAKAILELVQSVDGQQICYDHLAFRTFGAKGHGIDSIASFFMDYGYTQQDELRFPAKKLKAFWFSAPSTTFPGGGSGINGPLPRIFISELLVDEMSPQAQDIIKKYIEISGSGCKHAALASALGSLIWQKPLHSEFQQLARESEYAAWTLVNGYALNHVTISTHRLNSHLRDIKSLNHFLEENEFKLNSEGGVLKVSPDGLLLQSSTVADSISFDFSDGVTELVPCSYIEFAERLVLPQYKHIPKEEVMEFHRRDGFEVGNADKIFESTSKEQLTRRVA